MAQKIVKNASLEHSPTLNTVLMVEETIRKSQETLKISELKKFATLERSIFPRKF